MDKSSKAYIKAKNEADKHYGINTSIYKSVYIVKKYKENGGLFEGDKPPESKGIKRWMKEKWIQVVPYLKNGEIVECGASYQSKNGKACRPLERMNNETPITIKELLQIHTKSDLIKAATEKEKNPQKRLNWKSLNIK